VKMRKINSVSYNMSYLQDKDEHPETCITYSTCSDDMWKEYASVNRQAFKKSGQEGRCVEAREAIFIFPEQFYRLSEKTREEFLKVFIDYLQKLYNIEIYAAMHGKDADASNLHIHAMFMERQCVPEQDKIAKRNMYFNEKGKQVRAKKDAVDQDGNLLPGYRMVPKGECYGKVSWTAKNKWLRSKDFTRDLKNKFTDVLNKQLNQEWAKDMVERVVFDHATSPYLPLQDEYKPLRYKDPVKQEISLKKASELSEDIRKSNDLRKEYNSYVDDALMNGVKLETLVNKRLEISEQIKIACKTGQQHSINDILRNAIEWIKQRLGRLQQKLKQRDSEPIEQTSSNESKAPSIDDMMSNAAQRTKKSRTLHQSHDDINR